MARSSCNCTALTSNIITASLAIVPTDLTVMVCCSGSRWMTSTPSSSVPPKWASRSCCPAIVILPMATEAPITGSVGCATRMATPSWSPALMEPPTVPGAPLLPKYKGASDRLAEEQMTVRAVFSTFSGEAGAQKFRACHFRCPSQLCLSCLSSDNWNGSLFSETLEMDDGCVQQGCYVCGRLGATPSGYPIGADRAKPPCCASQRGWRWAG